MQKDNILNLGRELIVQKGISHLSVRKVAAYSNVSVGMFYGIFETIDDFVDEQNNITLKDLLKELKKVNKSADSFATINAMADCFIAYAKDNQSLWNLLGKSLSWQSSKSIASIVHYIDKEFSNLLPQMDVKKRKLSTRLLITSMFSVSNMLIEKPQDIKVLLNTYAAGLKVLELCK